MYFSRLKQQSREISTCYLFLYLINKQRVLNSAVVRFAAVLTTSPERFKYTENANYSVLHVALSHMIIIKLRFLNINLASQGFILALAWYKTLACEVA